MVLRGKFGDFGGGGFGGRWGAFELENRVRVRVGVGEGSEGAVVEGRDDLEGDVEGGDEVGD